MQGKDGQMCPEVRKGRCLATHLLIGNVKSHPQVLWLQHQFCHDTLLLEQCLTSFFIPAPCQEMTIEQLRHKAERV